MWKKLLVAILPRLLEWLLGKNKGAKNRVDYEIKHWIPADK